jgi:hypothetical protein
MVRSSTNGMNNTAVHLGRQRESAGKRHRRAAWALKSPPPETNIKKYK